MANSDYVPALSKQITYRTDANRYHDETKQGSKPRSLALFIPQQSILELAEYLKRLSTEQDKLKTGKVWNFETRENEELKGFYINGRGFDGESGEFGAINLQQIPASDRNSQAVANTPTQQQSVPVSNCPF